MSGRTAGGIRDVAAAAVLWGTTRTAQALGASHAPPLAAGAARVVIGGFLLLALGGRGLAARWAGLILLGAAIVDSATDRIR